MLVFVKINALITQSYDDVKKNWNKLETLFYQVKIVSMDREARRRILVKEAQVADH